MSNELVAILSGIGFFIVICGGVIGLVTWIEKSSDGDMGWSEKEAEKLQRQASKEFKHRQRLNVGGFWKF
jgi:hypothetical protein